MNGIKKWKWIKKDDNILKDLYLNDKSKKLISEKLNRTESSIQNRIIFLHLHRNRVLRDANFSQIKNKILEIYHSGKYSNREIAAQVGVCKETVSKYLAQDGLDSHWYQINKIEMIDENTALCKKCHEPKPLREFQYGRKGQDTEYRFAYCNKCRKKQCYENLSNDVTKFLRDRYYRLKRRCSVNNITFDLDINYFVDLYFHQDGKCFYTGREMQTKVGQGLDWSTLSVDKIIPEKGYVKGNIVFCMNKINTAKFNFSLDEIKEWMPVWYNKIQNHLLKNN